MKAASVDQCLLGAALAVVLAMGGWFVPAELRRGGHHRQANVSVGETWKADPLPSPDTIDRPAGNWNPPVAQSRGAEWTYDLFTPPEIRFDARTRRFAVMSPDEAVGGRNLAPGLELMEVKREPFRLQLVGYLGAEGHYLGAFEDRRSSEVILAESGRSLPELGLVITEITVHPAPGRDDGMSVSPRVATAVVRDLRTGDSTTLTSSELSYSDELRALLVTREDEDESISEYRAGEELESGDQSYRIARLELDPPAAELTPVSSTSRPHVRLVVAAKPLPEATNAVRVN